jgi:hypothetical protein
MRPSTRTTLLILGTLAMRLAVGEPLQAQESDEVQFKTSALELTFNGRIQIQASTNSCSEFPIPNDSACIGQFRLQTCSCVASGSR